jgi:hypothetical protein
VLVQDGHVVAYASR